MGWTKRQLIERAYSEIGIAGYAFDLAPEELEDALRTLDAVMAQWNGRGIRLGYPVPGAADGSDLDQDSNLPDWATEAAYLALALRIAPGAGKAVSQDTKAAAREALAVVMARVTQPPQAAVNALPVGAGHRAYWPEAAYFPETSPVLTAGPDGELDL